MNVLHLFETENIDDIKLGIQVVKSLNLQKEFERYFERSFIEYEDIFNNVVLVCINKPSCVSILEDIISNNLNMNKLRYYTIYSLICGNTHLIDYFDLTKIPLYSLNKLIFYKPGIKVKQFKTKKTKLIDIAKLYISEIVNRNSLCYRYKEDISWLLQIHPKTRHLKIK